MIDFTHIVNFIFRDKDNYKKIKIEDKETNFFIINRKFARRYPKYAQALNKKSIDKSIALDLWYFFFIKERIINIPDWYWKKSTTKKNNNKTKYTKDEIDFICQIHDISEDDFIYLVKNYPDDIENEISKYNKFNKK